MFEPEYEDGDAPYTPTQWELYSNELTDNYRMDWADRANSDFDIHVYLKKLYKGIDRVFQASLRPSPFVKSVVTTYPTTLIYNDTFIMMAPRGRVAV